MTATLASVTSTVAVYNVSAPTASAIAIFNGSTKVAYVTTTSAKFSVAPGKTYAIYAVKGPTTSSGLGQTSVSPVAPPPADTTPPVTTSNALASYTGSATITLTATDAGGSGVAHTYYILDGAAQVESRTIVVTALGAHTLQFWSVDGAGNAETHKTANFSVNAVPDLTAPVTVSNVATSYVGTASITLSATDGGGSGVAHTYYILDGAPQVEGTALVVSAIGAHTLEFWSVDGAGNIELHHIAAFTIAAVPDTTPPVTTSNALASYTGTATITLAATDAGGSGVAHTYYILDGAAQVESRTVVVSAVGTHTVEFWSVDGAGNAETPHHLATFSVKAVPDTTPPVTTSDALAAYVGTATITLTATDTGGSGVAHTYYTLDGGAQVESRTIVVSAVGTHTVGFWSVDGAGNAENPHKSATFSVTAPVGNDKTPPTTTSNATTYYTTTATITLTARDNSGGSGVSATYFSLDGAPRVAGTSVVTSVPGSHTVEFWSIDKAANEELPHKTATFMVDPAAPVTSSNAASFYPGPASVTLTATDGPVGSGVSATWFRLDGGAQTTGTVVAASTPGSHSIEFWSRDKAGNTETPHKSVAFIIDTVAPTTTSNAVATYSSSAHITFSPSDTGGSGVAHTYSILDGAPQVDGTSIDVAGQGAHSVEFWSVDGAGNAETPHKTANFTVDSVAPVTASDALPYYAAPANISLTASDTVSGVAHTYYRLDGAAPVEGTAVVASAEGTHTLEFWSVDAFGNAEAPHKTAHFAVDLSAPVTSSNATASYTATAVVTLTASDTVSGVAHTYFRLDGGTTAEGTALAVAASGAHTLEFWSADKAGNVETPHKVARFSVDTGAPTTTSNAVKLYTVKATIKLTARDTGSGVAHTYHVLDGGARIEGTTVVVTKLGAHTLEFWSVDALGNQESPHKRATFTVRPVLAKVTITRGPSAGTLTLKRKAGVASYVLSARVRHPNGTAWKGLRVVIQMRSKTSAPWESMYTLTSNSSGIVARAFAKLNPITLYYRWYVPSTPANYAVVTAQQKVVIR